jgi:predicted DNA-binding protein
MMYIMSDVSMVRTQIYLTEEQQRGLERLAAATGRRKSDLIREALDGYLADHQPKDWKDALEAVRGMWADRDDLDDFVRNLRAGWEKRLERLYGR